MQSPPSNPHFSRPVIRVDPVRAAGQSIGARPTTELAADALKLVLAVPRRLDYLALSSFLSGLSTVRLVATELSLTQAVETCKKTSPDVAVLDVSYPDLAAFTAGKSLLESGCLKSVAFFDDRFALWRAQRALSIPGTCYFTRDADIRKVCDEIRRREVAGGRAEVAARRPPSDSFLQSMEELKRFDVHQLLTLSRKEREVMEWLARGYTLREVAAILELAMSTVDNHKSRLMKKLNVHRTAHLTRIAYDAGVEPVTKSLAPDGRA